MDLQVLSHKIIDKEHTSATVCLQPNFTECLTNKNLDITVETKVFESTLQIHLFQMSFRLYYICQKQVCET